MTNALSAADKRKLSQFNFDTNGEYTINRNRRLIMAVAGEDKHGKSALGLGMPPPVMHFNFDRKIEQSSLDVLGVPASNLIIKEVRVDIDESQDLVKRKWDEVYEAYMWALASSSSIQSIVIDTETEMWALARLAYFGKVSQVMPIQYTQVNYKYANMISEADRHDKNVLFLRRLKKEYKQDNWTGKMEVAGFSQLRYLTQVNAEISRKWNEDTEQEEFCLEIVNNALKAGMNGHDFTGEMCTFAWVAALLTDTTPDEWT